MQKNYYNSRSVIVDLGFKKSQDVHYDIHKKKLMEIRNRRTDLANHQHEEFIKLKLGHKHSREKVKEELNPDKNKVKALVKHIEGIVHRRGQSVHGRSQSIQQKQRNSINEYRQYKNRVMENEKKEIAKQNKILLQKLAEQKTNKLTKKDLRKQFKVYESQRSLLRKVHYQSQKPKKRREKTVQVIDRQHKD